MGSYLQTPYSVGLWSYYTTSAHLFALDLILCMVLLISLASVKEKDGADGFKDKGTFEDEAEAKQATDALANHAAMEVWWKWTRFVVFFIFMTMVAGVVFATMAQQDLLHNKAPLYLHDKICIDAGWVYSRTDEETGAKLYTNGTFVMGYPTDQERFANRHLDPTGYNKMVQLKIMIPCAVVGFVVSGYATLFTDNVVKRKNSQIGKF